MPQRSPEDVLAAPTPEEERRHHRLRCKLSGLPVTPYRPPRQEHLLLRNRRFHVVRWGPEDRPPLLFLHGGNQTARTWDAVCHELAAEHHCVALDQRGHGESEWSNELDYGCRAHARDISALVEHLGCERLVIVGMSMGCLNGLRFALDEPGRVAAFVAVDAGPWIRFEGARPIADFVRRGGELRSFDEFVREALRFNARRDPRLLRMSLRHALRRLPNGDVTWKADRRLLRAPEDMEADLEGIRADLSRASWPLLVLRGAESRVLLDEDAERFAWSVESGRWRRVPDAGHGVQGDNPRALVEALRCFLADVGWGARAERNDA